MITFFERLDKFMIYKQLNDNKISIEAGISNGLIGKGRVRGAISQDNISKILNTYTDLDANWLLTGRGEMLRSESTDQQVGCKELEQQLNTVKIELKAAYEENGALKYQLKEAKVTIERLKNAGGNVYSE